MPCSPANVAIGLRASVVPVDRIKTGLHDHKPTLSSASYDVEDIVWSSGATSDIRECSCSLVDSL